MKGKIVLIVISILICAAISFWYAKFSYSTDFASFYRAARIITDRTDPVTDIYRIDDVETTKYGLPANEHFIEYRYSMFATYLISPLAVFNYDTANAIMIFINIICYTISVMLILRTGGATGRLFLYPFAFSFLWLPFIQNIRWGQINAIILLLITLAVLQASKKSNLWAGILLATATLFKPFTMAVTMVLCLKNWRILIGYLSLIFLALLLPGTRAWLHSFLWPPHPFFCYSALYRCLQPYGSFYFAVCALVIGAITAYITYRNRHLDYLLITSFALPAAFLSMPVLESNHLTLLIFTFAYLITRKLPTSVKVLAVISFGLIYVGSISIYGGTLIYLGTLILWATMAYLMTRRGRRDVNLPTQKLIAPI